MKTQPQAPDRWSPGFSRFCVRRNRPSKGGTPTSILFVLALVGGAFLWFFGAVLIQDRSFGFRDSANYYYPLFEWETSEWRAGRIPLWNPLDDTGTPVLADTTSSVLYPGKLVFALPVSYRLRYHIYVTMHVLLAASMAYTLARRWQASVDGAGLAALSYAFGGSVVFQYCNVVFLVGAAWLPAALLATDRMLERRSLICALALGAVLALMTLGGDPQAAYHAGMIAVLYACVRRRVRGGEHQPLPPAGEVAISAAGEGLRNERAPSRRDASYRHPIVLLACAACSGFLLAAVQILPAMQWAARSDRAVLDQPRNVYECVTWFNDKIEPSRDVDDGRFPDQIFGDPQHGTHLRNVYHFSVGPWHVADFLWPNCFGKMFPKNERWINALPAEGRTWTPSLYLGLLPLLLAAMMAWSWRTDSCVRFLVVLAVLSLIASFGWYGIGWLIHELRGAFYGGDAGEPLIGNPVGGLYWMMVVLLPGYVMFRFPAKLLVVTTLAISLLAARGWDRFVRDEPHKLARTAIVVVTFSLALAAAFGFGQPAWRNWLTNARADGIFGPIDVTAATSGVLVALAHAAVCGLLLVVMLKRFPEKARGFALLAMTAIELCGANAWMMITIDADVWRDDVISVADRGDSEPPPRFFREANASQLPAEWSQQSHEQRMEELVAWERTSLRPRHHLSHSIAMVGSHTTLRSLDTSALLSVQRQHARSTRGIHPDALLAPLSVGYWIVDADRELAGCEKLNVTVAEGVELWHEPRAYPRAWLVSRSVTMKPLPQRSHHAAEQRIQDIFLDGDQPRDLRSVVFIDASGGELFPPNPPLSSDAYYRVVGHNSQRVDVDVRTSSRAWLVLNDAFYPGWEATARRSSGEQLELRVYRANQVMRAVLVPPGENRVEFVYRPRRFWLGAVISGAAWIAALVLLAVCRRGKTASRISRHALASASRPKP